VTAARLMPLLLVGAGGFVGSVLRYVVSGLVHRSPALDAFPWGTLVVNVVGCLVIGVCGGLAGPPRSALTDETRLFLMVGILGGFTTFSTFGYETMSYLKDGDTLKAAMNVIVSVAAGLVAVWAGLQLSRLLPGA